MLVLTRKKGEGIVIGDDVLVSVHLIRGSKVSIAISAPRDVKIRREELPKKESDNAS